MTTVLEPTPPAVEPVAVEPAQPQAPDAPPAGPAPAAPPPQAPPLLTLAAVAMGAAGAAWMTGGIFRDGLARGVGVLGVLVAMAMLSAATRLERPALVQYLVLPVAGLVGGALVLPQAGSGSSSIPSLIGSAIRSGGVLQPPIAFDPGWKFILVILFAGLTAAGASLALALNRPRLGVVVALPVTVVTAIVQPDSAVVVSAIGAIILTAAALAVAYGAELARSGAITLQFETNRLLRGGALVLVLAVGVGLLSRSGLLFPQTQRSYVSPPQKPQVPPQTVPDHVLFTVAFSGSTKLKAPLQEGVLDTYDSSQQAWLLPAYDTRRLVDVAPPAPIPGQPHGGGIIATVTIADGAGSHLVPVIPGAAEIGGGDGNTLQYDPQTGDLQLRDRPAYSGFEYSISAPAPPSGAQLRSAGAPPAAMKQFLNVPNPPAQIEALLVKAPTDGFDRMQFLRQQLYSKVVAAGSGKPVDVPVGRVVQMLNGDTATPFEIIAGEALLARYAGVPSRIAYGYIGSDQTPDGSFAVHPKDGAAWLEAYFQGYGWVAIIGAPPHAQASLNQSSQTNPLIHLSDRLSLVVYVPVRQHTFLALYQQVRYWALVTVPPVVLLVVIVLLVPLAAKRLRARRRRRWGEAHGPVGQVAVAYCELRDTAADLGIGQRAATPLAFVEAVERDDEHEELAWLTTRAIWGDLRRDLRASDVAAAIALARSVTRRLVRGQPMLNRVTGAMARTSLRQPYNSEVPNAWFEQRPGGPNRHMRLRLRRRGVSRRRTLIPAAAALATVALVIGVLSSVSVAAAPGSPSASSAADATLNALVPAGIGGLTLQRETAAESAYRSAGSDSLVTTGHVYTVHQGPAVQASVQVSLLKPDISPRDDDFVTGLENTIGGGSSQPLSIPVAIFDGHCRCAAQFHVVRADELAAHFYQRIYETNIPDQRVYFWFPPGDRTLVILVVREVVGTAAADDLALSLVDYQHGAGADLVPVPPLPSAAASASSTPASTDSPVGSTP
jgi:hypothetical protein